MSGSFSLPAGFAIGAAPPASPAAAAVPPAQAAPVAVAAAPSGVPAQAAAPQNPYALPPGFTVGATPPAPVPNGMTTDYIDVSLSGQDADQTNKPLVPSFPPVPPAPPSAIMPTQGSAPAPPQPVAPSAAAPVAMQQPAAPAYAAQPTPAVPPPSSNAAPIVTALQNVDPTSWQGQYLAARARAQGVAIPPIQPATPAAQGGALPYAGHLASLAGRDVIDGAAGTVLGLPALAARGVDYLTGSHALQPIANAPATFDNLLTDAGFAQPQGPGERYGSAILQNIVPAIATGGIGSIGAVTRALDAAPSAIRTLGSLLMAPGVGTGTKIAAGTGAGVAQQAAADDGAGTRGQLAAALLGGLAGGGVSAGARAGLDYGARLGLPLTGGRTGLAGQALLSQSSDPATFGPRLAAGMAEQQAGASPQRLPTSPATPGMLANDQGMMGFEQGIRNNSVGNDAYRGFDVARAQSQVQAVRDLANPGAHSAQERGFTIRNALDQAHDAAGVRTSQMYAAAAPGAAALPLDTVHQHIASELDGVYGPGSGGAPGPLKAVWRELAQRQQMPGTHLMRMSQRLGNMAGQFKMAGNRVAASAAMRTRDAIENVAGSPAWEQARATRRAQGETFGRNAEGSNAVGSIRNEDRYGSPTMQDDKVADRAIKDGASVRQVFAALDRGLADARASGASAANVARLEENAADVRTAMREHFIDGLMRKGSVSRDENGNEELTITPKQWQNYWRDRKEVGDQLFTQSERRLIDADFAEHQRFIDAGRSNGSNTMKNAATARFMQRLAAGHIPGELRTARLLAVGLPIALAKGATATLDLVHPGLGAGLEHTAHRAGEFYFLTRGGHGAAHNALSGIINPGAHAAAEHVREAVGDPQAVKHLIDAVRAGKVTRLAAAASSRPLRQRTRELLTRRLIAASPAASQAQQGRQRPPPTALRAAS